MRGYRLWLVVIVLVTVVCGWISLPSNPGIHLDWNDDGDYNDPFEMNKDLKVVQGLDLQGGSRVLLRAALNSDQYDDSTMDQAVKRIERRVNGLGVSEAVVQKQEGGRIIVELPGVSQQEVAFDAIKSTGLLEFVDFSTAGTIPEGTCVLTTEQVKIAEARLSEGETPQAYSDYTCEGQTSDAPADPAQLQADGTPFQTAMTGAGLADAAAANIGTVTTSWAVNFVLRDNGEGVDDFVNFVATHANQSMAIILDGRLVSAPTIQSDLASAAAAGTMDSGIITGDFTRDEAEVLAAQLKYGSLPIPLDIIAFDTIGPTLGEISVDRSIRAGIVGIITVLLFMLIYYRIPGIAAALALILFALINFALFKFIPVTLSLPAIIGFLISIGTAVDGNILIFERMKEELRNGRTMDRAIDAGFDRAWTSIRDSNFSTIIICFILYFFGSAFGASAVRGFAITLGMGLVINLFTAVIATRTFMHTLVLLVGTQLRARPRLLGV
ncbi:protein translocase subunit SecD [Aggregatilinea lenta]|uniref:protein translocase subunit SecD n=1 Tax=Aggregatilinea lenta TaxID=913108 RepID=UPI000E5AAF2D|nr:protein translocase subunit SecD [Aggregatilinea lenta]